MSPKRFLLLTVVLVTGCGESRPTNPTFEILSNPPVEIDTQFFGTVSVRINDVDVDSGNPIAEVGQPLGGVAQLNPINDRLFVGGSSQFLIRIQPTGSGESDWREWSFKTKGRFEFSSLVQQDGTAAVSKTVRVPPAEYDIRCYVIMYNFVTGKTRFLLVKKGQVEIVAATSNDANRGRESRTP